MPEGSIFGQNRLRRLRADQWPLDDGITVVLFAGLGGACAGLEAAGCPVAVANNHDDVALAAHAAMHPHTRHIRGDIFDVDPLVATNGRPVKNLWASPDCTDHSVAKGGAPRSPRVRSLPWQVCRWIAKTDAENVYVENVREIRNWTRLVAKRDKATGRVLKLDGTVAAPGERVPVQQQHLVRDKKRLGRTFRRWVRHIRSLGRDYEDRDLNCADYGVPTARRRFFAVIRKKGLPIGWPERTHAPRAQAQALGLLPWRAAAEILDWSLPIPSIFGRKKDLVLATQRRIAAGIKRFVLEVAAAGRRPFLIPVTHPNDARVYSADEPLRTITTAQRGEFALVAPQMTKFRKGSSGADVMEPIPTITANGHSKREGGAIPLGVSAGLLVQTGYGERPGQAPRALDIEAPLGTQVDGAKHGVVAAWMVKHNLDVVGNEAEAPLSTLTTSGSQIQVGAAFLAHHRGASTACDAGEPIPSMTTMGAHLAPAAAFLAKLRGTSTVADAEAPVPTLTAGGGQGGGHVAAVAAFMTKFYGVGGTSQGCDEALHTLTTLARFGVVTVTIEGELYAIADIGMRMLAPHEAAAAHEMELPKEITIDGKTRALTKSECFRLIGNSVPPRMAMLLAQANSVNALAAQGARAA